MTITDEEVIVAHDYVINEFGGSYGVRDYNLLSSCINAPFQSFDSKDVFPSIEEKAARLGFGIAKNHAFIDGNKRTAAHIMTTYLYAHNIELNYTQQELVDIFVSVASNKATYEDLLKWIKNHY